MPPEQKPYWDGVWAYPLISVDYAELEKKFAMALVNRFRVIKMPIDNWHHVVIFIDGVKEVDKINVPREQHGNLRNSRILITAGILFTFGIFQILLGFGSLFLTESTEVTLFMFILGTMLATAGLVSWIFGVRDV